MVLLVAFPITLNLVLNVAAIVLALALGLIVLRFVLKAARLIFAVGCLGVVAVAVFYVVMTFLHKG